MWRIPALQPADPERLDFPTQKPEDLLSIVIGATSNPGDPVLDCFLGSGTTAIVAQRLRRRPGAIPILGQPGDVGLDLRADP